MLFASIPRHRKERTEQANGDTPKPSPENPSLRVERTVEIVNRLGLHARAAALLASRASAFEASIWLDRHGDEVNAKSIMGLMTLAAAQGTTLTLIADGDDAEAAVDSLSHLVANRFEEND